MKRIYHVLMVIIIAFISFKCQKELSGEHAILPMPNNHPSPITVTLQGNILDENGQPAAGVKISAGSKNALTNPHGYFRIVDAQLDKNASVVTAEQPGYFKAYRSFRATTGANQLVIKLVKKTLAGTINALTGGQVALANGAKISLPANGTVKASGGAYSENVRVYAAYIDPTARDIGKTVPGSFMADDKNKKRVVLSSYGMLAVELESSAGERLQIQTGNAATLIMPIPNSLLSSAPASISLWYVDEQTGIWKEQGTAKKTGNNYTGEVKHFSYWNCDISSPATGFSAVFKASDGAVLANMYVSVQSNPVISDSQGGGYAHGYTDSLGQVSGLVPANEDLVLTVQDQCYNIIYSQNIGPFADNTDLGTIIIPRSVSALVTVKGKLLSCNNTPVANGYAVVYWNNFVSYVNTDAEGKFSTSIVTCSVTGQNCEILGVDEATQQQGALLTIPFTANVADAGNIVACGLSSTQFINYNLDGTDHVILNNDSLYAFTSADAGTFFTTIQGYNLAGGELLNFNFSGKPEPGVYLINSFMVENFNAVNNPFNVTISSFPQVPGEFYEGNFSGTFSDASVPAVIHNISCTFRLRKNY